MPLTSKGQKIMSSMKSQYGDKKGEQVFYASRNAGKISGVDPESSKNGHQGSHLHKTEHHKRMGHTH